jgi:hypothetical protein
MSEVNEKELFAELEALGEAEVRIGVAKHIYGNATRKRLLVDEWLRSKERTRAEASASEEIEIARSAKDAAWEAAEAASRAATAAERAADTADRAAVIAKAANARATIAIILTAIMAAAAVIGLFLQGR